ncbi:hypothetical protein ACFVH4_28105 [Nocardia ignorata]|uniref:hypothetical protein n=1 Tax=Nocardia ignorata TaxID=145285 RepID=UPI00363F45B0
MDTIRLSLGNPNNISATQSAWSAAISSLSQAVDGSNGSADLESTNANLKARWAGNAAQAGTDYIAKTVSSTRAQKTQLIDLNTHINNIGAEVQTFYATNIAHISNYAARIAEAEADMYEIVADFVTSSLAVITGKGGGTGTGGSTTRNSAGIRLVADFMKETGQVLVSLENYLTKIGGEVGSIKDKVNGSEIPGKIAAAATDPDIWRPRSTTGIESGAF